MKNRKPFDVPLSLQVVALLQSMQEVNGQQKYVMASPWKRNRNGVIGVERPISENTLQFTVRKRMGYAATVHGFRATATTVFSQNGWSEGAQERQLAHVEGNKTKAAYNRAQHWPERQAMMQWWSNWIEASYKNRAPPKGPGAWINYVDDLQAASDEVSPVMENARRRQFRRPGKKAA